MKDLVRRGRAWRRWSRRRRLIFLPIPLFFASLGALIAGDQRSPPRHESDWRPARHTGRPGQSPHGLPDAAADAPAVERRAPAGDVPVATRTRMGEGRAVLGADYRARARADRSAASVV